MGRVDAAGSLDQPAFRELLEQVRRESCWLKVSGSDRVSAAGPPFYDALTFARALIQAEPERMVWAVLSALAPEAPSHAT
jgi:2-pyrone-4,6-dicarboxylate lactonase